jgi:hypothetical protein
MANIGWNADLAWSENSWGDLSDVSVSLTGIGLNVAQASVTTTEELNAGWGRETGWGTLDWGDNSLSVQIPLTGQQLNISQGDEATQIDVTPNISGEALNSALGAVDPEPDESLVGQQVNLALASVTAFTDVSFSITGLGLTIAQGDEEVDNITFATPSGEQLNVGEGIPVVGGIARVFPTGVEAAISTPGNVSFSITGSVIPTGSQVNIAQGTAILDANTLVDVTGQQLNTSTGTLGFKSSGSVQLTGNQVNIALGNEVSQVWTIVDTGTSVAYTEVSTGSSVSWNDIDTAA